MPSSFKILIAGAAAAMLALSAPPAAAQPQKAAATQMPGKPGMSVGAYDLGTLGYQMEEYAVSGTATSYRLAEPILSNGAWKATTAATAPYKTRIIVLRPIDAARFNGTVLVEWFNVTGGQDGAVDWTMTHRELMRKGYAYVGVSAQKMGIDGGPPLPGVASLGGVPMKKSDPARYGSLVHPGDAYSFDMFSQVGALAKASRAGGILGPLTPRRVIAAGESQSAAFLTTYVNAVDPLARVFDGFLIHSRFGSSSSIGGVSMGGAAAKMPDFVQFRRDLRVPVMSVITETDLIGSDLSGYHAARRPDDARLRVWEVAGTAHADNYLFGGGTADSGLQSIADLAKTFVPTNARTGPNSDPVNTGIIHHYVMHAAVHSLDNWLRTGRPPTSTPVLTLTPGAAPSLVLDPNGLAKGGVRTPWVDVPTIRLSGQGDPSSFIGRLAGKGIPFDQATLARLYPGGKADYLGKFTVALDKAIRAGHILPDDRKEILDIAAVNYPSP